MKHPFEGIVLSQEQDSNNEGQPPRRLLLKSIAVGVPSLMVFGCKTSNDQSKTLGAGDGARTGGAARGNVASTRALREEGGGFVTSQAIGEEGGGWVTSQAIGEEGGGWVTSQAIGEEGGGWVSSAAVGEEGGSWASTEAEGKEGGGFLTTQAVGEEGGKAQKPRVDNGKGNSKPPRSPIITSQSVGEEGGDGPLISSKSLGEEGAGDVVSSQSLDEEGGNVTSWAKGEEGGDWASTEAVGEEGGSLITSLSLGEEGGRRSSGNSGGFNLRDNGGAAGDELLVTSQALGEEGGEGNQVTSQALGEEGGDNGRTYFTSRFAKAAAALSKALTDTAASLHAANVWMAMISVAEGDKTTIAGQNVTNYTVYYYVSINGAQAVTKHTFSWRDSDSDNTLYYSARETFEQLWLVDVN